MPNFVLKLKIINKTNNYIEISLGLMIESRRCLSGFVYLQGKPDKPSAIPGRRWTEESPSYRKRNFNNFRNSKHVSFPFCSFIFLVLETTPRPLCLLGMLSFLELNLQSLSILTFSADNYRKL